MTLPLQKNLMGISTAPASCVDDITQDRLVEEIIRKVSSSNWSKDDNIVPLFIEQYKNWISSTKINSIFGLELFPSITYSQGTTESFDKFYLRNHKRRFRCYRGEYLYHQLTWKNLGYDWKYIDDEPLKENDAVICSFPFADTGNQKHTVEFLDNCYTLGIPVLFDSAFFGISGNHIFDFSHPSITDVCFSFSKTFPVSGIRIGIRFSKDTSDGLNIYNKTHYVNKFGAAVGLHLFEYQSPDSIFLKYRNKQLLWCDQYNLVPSQCVIFGIDYNHKYDNHNRGSKDSNRICFAKFFNYEKLYLTS